MKQTLSKTNEILDLEDWWLCEWGTDKIFNACSPGKPCLVGYVENHPDYEPDVICVKSSQIKEMSEPGVFKTDRGYRYRLGAPSAAYIERFPGVYEDLMVLYPPPNGEAS